MERTLDPTFRARAFQWIDGVTVPAPQAARTLAVGRQDEDHLACAQTQKSGCSTGRSALLSAYRTQQLGHNAMSVLCQFQLRAILPPPRAVVYERFVTATCRMSPEANWLRAWWRRFFWSKDRI